VGKKNIKNVRPFFGFSEHQDIPAIRKGSLSTDMDIFASISETRFDGYG
jgi:hypothetical protein